MTTDEAICVHCRAPAGRPVAAEGSWFCHSCRQWQPWRDRLNHPEDVIRRERDEARAEVAQLRAVLEGIRDMDWPPGHAVTAARDMQTNARAALDARGASAGAEG
jgi:hypothetical protein